jgi:hypothetical protein
VQDDPVTRRLRELESVTDAALAYLPLDGLLNQLLTRVAEILDVDTAAILLLENDGRQLVARAAKGIEEEVSRGVRIPLGRDSRAGSPASYDRSASSTSRKLRSSIPYCARRASSRCSACRCLWRAA